MSRIAKVKLTWLISASPHESRRGQTFSVPARFDDQGDDWTRNAWSVVITVQGMPDVHGQQSATAKFLFANAPQEWLSKGKRFTLYEGKLAVADAVVEQVLRE